MHKIKQVLAQHISQQCKLKQGLRTCLTEAIPYHHEAQHFSKE